MMRQKRIRAATAALFWTCAAIAGAVIPVAGCGADVPYVPTPWNVVDAMLDMAKVGPDDYVIDLGSGDGRIVIAAAKKHGARGFGVDIDGALVAEANREAQRQGVGDRVSFYTRNLFITDISKATVLTMYLLPRVILQLRPRLLSELRPGTRIVSHDFDLEAWQPDGQLRLPVPDKPYGQPSSDVFLWIVPADASGVWRWRLTVGGVARDYELKLDQTFQILNGLPVVSGRGARFGSGRMRGEHISFVVVADIDGRDVRHEFNGRLSGDSITGRVNLHGGMREQIEWQAVRSARGKMNSGIGLPASDRRHFMAEEQR